MFNKRQVWIIANVLLFVTDVFAIIGYITFGFPVNFFSVLGILVSLAIVGLAGFNLYKLLLARVPMNISTVYGQSIFIIIAVILEKICSAPWIDYFDVSFKGELVNFILIGVVVYILLRGRMSDKYKAIISSSLILADAMYKWSYALFSINGYNWVRNLSESLYGLSLTFLFVFVITYAISSSGEASNDDNDIDLDGSSYYDHDVD